MSRLHYTALIGFLCLCLILSGCEEDATYSVSDEDVTYYPNGHSIYFMVNPNQGWVDGVSDVLKGHAKMCVEQEDGYLLAGHAIAGNVTGGGPGIVEIRFDTNMETEARGGSYTKIVRFYKRDNWGIIPIASQLTGVNPGNVSSTEGAEMFMRRQAKYQWYFVFIKEFFFAWNNVTTTDLWGLDWEAVIEKILDELGLDFYTKAKIIVEAPSNKYAEAIFKVAGFWGSGSVGHTIEDLLPLGNNTLAGHLDTHVGISERDQIFVIDDYRSGQFINHNVPLDAWGPAVLWAPVAEKEVWIWDFTFVVPIITPRSPLFFL